MANKMLISFFFRNLQNIAKEWFYGIFQEVFLIHHMLRPNSGNGRNAEVLHNGCKPADFS